MSTDTDTPITRNFLRGRRRRQLSVEERAALEAAVVDVQPVAARRTLIRRGEVVRTATLVVSGFLCRYMDARDGFRQLVSLQVPGDFVDLHGYPLQRLDHDIATLSDGEVALIPHDRLTSIVERMPHLGRMLWFSTLLDAAMHREWIFRIGRLEATGRVAHFLCETQARLRVVGMATDDRFHLPLTQQDIGEACGLTSVHVNRTLRRLREAGLVELANREVHVLNGRGLAQLGEFEPDYLFLDDGDPPTP
jgi:CRP-like cAMP-binding protein